MRKIYYTFLLPLIIFSCKHQSETNLEKMKTAFEKSLTDKAFKDNYKLKIIELKAISYDTLTENTLDTLKLSKYGDKYDHFKKLCNLTLERAQLESQSLRLNASIGSKTLTDISREDLNKYLKEAKEYQDSMTYYASIDSTIRETIKNRKKPNEVYEGKFFLKAVASKDGKDENIMDTMYYYFDKQIKLIDLSNL